MREIISVDTKKTVRPEGILVPLEVLDNVFSTHAPSICANTAYPSASSPKDRRGLLIITNVEGADELIGLLDELGTTRSGEIAQLLRDARVRNR